MKQIKVLDIEGNFDAKSGNFKATIIMKEVAKTPICQTCGSDDVGRGRSYSDRNLWECRECKRQWEVDEKDKL